MVHKNMDYSRRMAVIVFSDIKKSTEKMELDENLMVRLLREHERIFRSISLQHGGRIVKNRGDGFMIEFSAATQAVKCCINIQKAFRKYNQGKPADDAIQVRMGIHIGEVVQENADLLGIAVNIAARLEPLAEPGGICISRHVYDSIKSSMKLNVIDLGVKELKGINEPRRCFSIVDFPDDSVEENEHNISNNAYNVKQDIKLPAFEKAAQHPSDQKIAVLPFKIISSNPDDQYLGEGFAGALVFELSSQTKLTVQPLESILSIEKNAQNPQYMHSIFGANFIVMGNIQKFGSMLRLQVNMVNAASGKNLYSEAFKTIEEHLFDNVLSKIIKSIIFNVILLTSDEMQASFSITKPLNPVAGTLYLKGSYLDRQVLTWYDKKGAISLLEKAVDADPNYPLARVALARAYMTIHGRWQNDPSWNEKALQEAQTAYELNPELYETNEVLGRIYLQNGQLDKAEKLLNLAIVIQPGSCIARATLSALFYKCGKINEARAVLEQAIELSDDYNDRFYHADLLNRIAMIDSKQGGFAKAIGLYNEALAITRQTGNRYLEAGVLQNIGTTYQNVGRREEAVKHYRRCVEILREIGDKRYVAGTLGNIGQSLATLGELKPALVHFSEALEISRSIGDRFIEANILTQQGYVLNSIGRNQEAIEAYQAALKNHRESGYRLKESATLNNLAALYCDLGQHDEALQMYAQTRDIAAETRNFPLLASVHLNIGEIYELKDDSEGALEQYKIAEKVFDRIEAGQYLPYLYLFRGRVYFSTGNHERALSDFKKAFECQNIQSSIRLRVELYNTLCRIKKGESLNWLPVLNSIVDELEKLGSYPEWIEGLRVIGGWMIDHELKEKGRNYLNKALDLARESGMAWEVDMLEKTLARC